MTELISPEFEYYIDKEIHFRGNLMQLTNLETLIQNANRAYRQGTPVMSDEQFDKLEAELKALMPTSSVLLNREDDWGSEFQEDSPLTLWMGSQDKALNQEELNKWVNKVAPHHLHASFKMDGMSVELTYIKGAFVKAISRGNDGQVGKVLTPIVMHADFPKSIRTASEITVVRAEIILPKSGLVKANEYLQANGRDPMANVRNGAVAITRTMKNVEMAHLLRVVAFDLEEGLDHFTLEKKFDRLNKLGFSTPRSWTLSAFDASTMSNLIRESEEVRESLDFDIDGIVFSVNSLTTLESMGAQDNCKRGQIAFKFQAKGAYVTITDIEWSFDGTESVMPVAIFDPIEIGGSTITRSSLKSFRWLMESGVGIGSTLKLVRSGDVIPTFIDGDIKYNPQFQQLNVPTFCPHCQSKVKAVGAQLACVNDSCPSKEAARINKFFKATDVKGLAVASLRAYTKCGVTLEDFFNDDLSVVTQKIQKDPDISMAIWDKVRKQIEQRV